MNIHTDDWDVERETVKIRFVGHALGTELVGGVVLELAPGHRGPYHLHHGNEELALVLAGAVTVRGAHDERLQPLGRRGTAPIVQEEEIERCGEGLDLQLGRPFPRARCVRG